MKSKESLREQLEVTVMAFFSVVVEKSLKEKSDVGSCFRRYLWKVFRICPRGRILASDQPEPKKVMGIA
jgi:hypothetical protein